MRQHMGGGYCDTEEGTVIFVGHARLPQSLAPVGACPVLSMEIEVDMRNRRAVEVATRGVLPRAEALLRDIPPAGRPGYQRGTALGRPPEALRGGAPESHQHSCRQRLRGVRADLPAAGHE